jgi:hypothetical protein
VRIAALYKKVFDKLDFDGCKGTAFIWVVQVLRVSLTIFL